LRFATYAHDGKAHTGVVDGAGAEAVVHPLAGDPEMTDVVTLGLSDALALGAEALGQPGRPLADVRLLAPLKPTTMRDFVAFEEHVSGVRRSIEGSDSVPEAWYDAPTFYFTNPHTVIGPDDEVAFPAASVARDFELEVAVVIGREGTSVPAADAAGHIFGYTLLNDWSARDLQRREMQVGLGPAKGKDFAASLGPWIVTADELEPHRDAEGFLDLWCSVEVNGVEVGSDLFSNVGWTFEAMVAHASASSRVLPGDVLGSGTAGHGGCLAELWGLAGRQEPPPLRDGDVVTITVEGIGSLTNQVGSAAPVAPLPAVRRRDTARARARHRTP
jgi:2-keto-4-pentenoate hydratase/2-oxohepta-3-ene-1,7-dioic acid hydratase in catechol pathway